MLPPGGVRPQAPGQEKTPADLHRTAQLLRQEVRAGDASRRRNAAD